MTQDAPTEERPDLTVTLATIVGGKFLSDEPVEREGRIWLRAGRWNH